MAQAQVPACAAPKMGPIVRSPPSGTARVAGGAWPTVRRRRVGRGPCSFGGRV